MFCPSCGKEIIEGVHFCPYCGHEMVEINDLNNALNTSDDSEVSSSSMKQNIKPFIIGGICAVVVACLAIGGLLYWNHCQDVEAQKDFDRVHSLHSVSIGITSPSYTPAATRIPVQIQGTNSDGAAVDEVQFIDGAGQGILLMQGSYVLSFPSSPLLEDGSLYSANPATIEVSLDEGLQFEEPVDAPNPVVEFAVQDPLSTTEEQISLAHDYAIQDIEQDVDGLKAESLTVLATDKRNQAIADKQAADEAARAAAEAEAAAKKAACHFDAGAFYLDVPESWYGRWTTTETGEDRRPSAGGAMVGGKNLYYTFLLDGTKMFVVATYQFNIGGADPQYWVGNSSKVFMPLDACSAEDADYVRNSLVFTGVNPYEGTL